MRIDIISVVPDLMQSFFAHSICKRAAQAGLVEVHLHDLHDYSTKKHKQIDDYPFGGGAGMVISVEPLSVCLDSLLEQRTYDEIIFFSPDGIVFKQGLANQLSLCENMIFICGHYKGIDERIRSLYITHELSIGDYVLSGGELAATVVVDAIGRLIPGVLNDETSALTDSFQDNLLAPAVYTRPKVFQGLEVPEVLLNGDHKKIEQWRAQNALERTQERRPDLLNE